MKGLYYEKLELQEYFSNFDVIEARTIFSFRVRMAKFSGNFRGARPPDPCPLCASHLGNQDLSVQCPVIKLKINVKEDYKMIFQQHISKNLGKT